MADLALPVGKIGLIFEEIADGVNDTQVMLSAYVEEHPAFHEVGCRVLAAWNEGVTATSSAGLHHHEVKRHFLKHNFV